VSEGEGSRSRRSILAAILLARRVSAG